MHAVLYPSLRSGCGAGMRDLGGVALSCQLVYAERHGGSAAVGSLCDTGLGRDYCFCLSVSMATRRSTMHSA